MAQPPSPTRFRPSRRVWLGLFWIMCLVLNLWLAYAWPEQGLADAVHAMLRGTMSSVALFFFASWFNPRHQDYYSSRHQFFWLILLMVVALFPLRLALNPQWPPYDAAGQALGWPLGYAIVYTILYGRNPEPPLPEIVARNDRQFRWVIAIGAALTIVSGVAAWYRWPRG